MGSTFPQLVQPPHSSTQTVVQKPSTIPFNNNAVPSHLANVLTIPPPPPPRIIPAPAPPSTALHRTSL